MPKIKTPKVEAPIVETPSTEVPKVDMSSLISNLTEKFGGLDEAKAAVDNAHFDLIVECRAFREENPTVERGDIKLAIQTAVAEHYGLKLAQVQNKPTKDERINAEVRSKRESSYVLVSTLLGAAWAKDEKQEAKVVKLLDAGETRFTVIRDASRKPSTKVQRDPDAGKITVANFADKYGEFATKAFADIGKDWKTIYNLLDEAREALERAITESPKD